MRRTVWSVLLLTCASFAVTTVASSGSAVASNARAERSALNRSVSGRSANLGKLTIVRIGDGVEQFMLDIAVSKGFFEQAGFSPVDLVNTGTPSVAVGALLQGDANIYAGATPAVLAAFSKGATNLKFIASAYKPLSIIVTLGNGWLHDHPVSSKATLCDKVKNLKGARVADLLAGSAIDLVNRYMFSHCGMNPQSDVSLVPFGTTAAMYAAFKGGQVDALTLAEPFSSQAIADGAGTTYIRAAQFPEFKGWMDGAFTVNDSQARSNPTFYTAFLKAYYTTERWALGHPAAAVAVLAKVFTGVTPAVLKRVWTSEMAPKTGFTWQSILNPAISAVNVKSVENFVGGVDVDTNQIVDSSFSIKAASALKALQKTAKKHKKK